MVALSTVQASNSLVSSALPPGLVAVFVGATSGIGEATLKQFAKHARKPRAYFVGRSQDAGDRIMAECKALNQAGEYIFIKADVSLIRVVDEVCGTIKAKEKDLNILFLSAGLPSMDRSETSEHLHLLTALTYYSRLRFIANLLPLLHSAPVLRRVVTVGGSGYEGPLDSSDFPARQLPLLSVRGHISTLLSLGLEAVARVAPDVSFVHDYPGTVDTSLPSRMKGLIGVVLRAYVRVMGRWICVPIQECGERHLYLATSAKYPPASGGRDPGFAVPLEEGIDLAQGTTGQIGSGAYSIGWDGEGTSSAVVKVLTRYRDEGMLDQIWRHTESEFKRITGHDEDL